MGIAAGDHRVRQDLVPVLQVDPDGRVRLHASPEQLVPVVCGGLGNLHCIVLPTWGESVMQAGAVVRPA